MASLVTSVEFIEHTFDSSVTVSSGTLSNDQDISNCVPFISWYGDTDYPDGQFFDAWFEDNGTPSIHFQRTNSRSTALYLKIYVVEFDPDKVKVYQGQLPTTISNSPETTLEVTTASGGLFDTDHSVLKLYHRASTSESCFNYHLVRGYLTTSSGSYGTDISLKRRLTSGSIYGHYYIFESLNDDFSVSHMTGSLGASVINYPKVYDWHNSFLLSSYCGDSTTIGGLLYITIRSYLWGNSSVHINKNSSSLIVYYNTQLIEFNNDATASGVRYCPKITSYHNMDTSTTERTLDLYTHLPSSTATIITTQNPTRDAGSSIYKQSSSFNAVWLTNSGTQYVIKRASMEGIAYPTYYCVDWEGVQPLYPDLGTNISPMDSLLSPVKSIENRSVLVYEHVQPYVLTKGQDVSNCIVFMTGHCYDQTSSYNQQYRHEMLTYFRGNELFVERGNQGYTGKAELSVVEFYPDQVKVQQGSFIIGINQLSTTVTIESVDTSKTFLVFGHFYGSNEDEWGYHMVRGRITNSTTLTFSRELSNSYSIMGTYYIAEDLGNYWKVAHWSSSSAVTATVVPAFDDSFPIWNTFTLMSTSSVSNSDGPAYSTWRSYYHSPTIPARMEKYSSSFNNTVSLQVINFLDNSKIRTHYRHTDLTTTQESTVYDLYNEWEGNSNLTPIWSNLNGVSRNCSTNSNANIQTFHRVKFLSETNQIEVSRNYGSTSATSQGTTFTVDWQGFESTAGDYNYNNLGYFIKSMERFSFTGSTRRKVFYPSKNQNLYNCLPIATWSIGEDTGSNPEYMSLAFWIYPDINRVHLESFWASNNPGIDVEMVLLEFDPLQVKVQHGTTNILSGDSTDLTTISGVDISKAFIMVYCFPNDNVGDYFGSATASARFNSSTEIEFKRGLTTGNLTISWFVTECLQDQWSVDHSEINNSSVTYYDFNFGTSTPMDKTISVGSYTSNHTSMWPAYVYFRMYPSFDYMGVYRIRANRQDNYAQIERMNMSRIAFNSNLDVIVTPVNFYFGTTTNTITVDLGHEVNINSTVIMNGMMLGAMRTNTTSTSTGPQRAFSKAVLQDSSTLLITRAEDSLSAEAWGHVYVMEFALLSHGISGVVREKGVTVSRKLNFHNTATGSFLGGTTSSGLDGTYSFYTTYSGSTYAVCFDDIDGIVYNGLIETDVLPAVISGTFPYDMGWV